jgi:L-2-hydroxyglutarate oxidase LhgO
MTDLRHHVIVIGGGVVVLGVALEITRRIPSQQLLVLEKEDRVARHQSGHNSEIIHSGIYYKLGSLKAGLCFTAAAAKVDLQTLDFELQELEPNEGHVESSHTFGTLGAETFCPP